MFKIILFLFFIYFTIFSLPANVQHTETQTLTPSDFNVADLNLKVKDSNGTEHKVRLIMSNKSILASIDDGQFVQAKDENGGLIHMDESGLVPAYNPVTQEKKYVLLGNSNIGDTAIINVSINSQGTVILKSTPHAFEESIRGAMNLSDCSDLNEDNTCKEKTFLGNGSDRKTSNLESDQISDYPITPMASDFDHISI